jgi:hypothetical protein
MKAHHTRIIEINWVDGEFPNITKEIQTVIGKLATYSMPKSTDCTMQYLSIDPCGDGEFRMCIRTPVNPYSTYEDGSTKYYGGPLDRFSELRTELRSGGPCFTIGAVFSNGVWGYHS